MNVKKKVYLSGPIMDERADHATTWREIAKAQSVRDVIDAAMRGPNNEVSHGT